MTLVFGVRLYMSYSTLLPKLKLEPQAATRCGLSLPAARVTASLTQSYEFSPGQEATLDVNYSASS